MKIVIDKILDENIYFSTDYGMAKGIWKGANRPIQKEYYVELDIDGLYSYDNVFVNNTKEYQMRIIDGKEMTYRNYKKSEKKLLAGEKMITIKEHKNTSTNRKSYLK